MSMLNIETKKDAQDQTVELCYGMKDEKLIHISDAVSGLECGCQCPACGTSLIARKGDVRRHHFAHQQGQDARSCLETVLHLYAKQVVAEQHKVLLPDTYLSVEKKDDARTLHQKHIYETGVMAKFTQVSLEVARDSYRADAVGFLEGFGEIDIEIRVTHEVDQEKREKVRAINKPMIEIDLSTLSRDASPEDILEAVLYTAPREWIFNPFYSQQLRELELQVINSVDQANLTISGLISPPEEKLSSVKGGNILLGYKFANGYSHKNRSDFELSKAYFAKPLEAYSSKNFRITHCGGYEVEEVRHRSCLFAFFAGNELSG